ncbi:OsmC family protein [Pedobacter sp. UYEF25]
MATSKVIYQGNLRTASVHLKSGNEIITDAPIDNKGKGEAFSPTDLLATSLANCMLTVIGIAAQEHGFSIDGASADVTKFMAESPRRVCEIAIDVTFPKNDYTDKIKKIIEHSANTCPVHFSLHPDIKKSIRYIF